MEKTEMENEIRELKVLVEGLEKRFAKHFHLFDDPNYVGFYVPPQLFTTEPRTREER